MKYGGAKRELWNYWEVQSKISLQKLEMYVRGHIEDSTYFNTIHDTDIITSNQTVS